jgi:glycosyltransferase involved in cell wall biosynthesis
MTHTSTPLVAVSGSLNLGGSSTFLVNLARAFHDRNLVLPIVVTGEENAHQEDFNAFGGVVTTISRRGNIYEDRLAIAYRQIARWRPQAVIACLSGESFETLRVVPPGCRRIGMIQSHDLPLYKAHYYAPWLDCMVGVSAQIARHLQSMPEFSACRIEEIPYGIAFQKRVERHTKPDEPLRVIYVGRMVEEQKRVSRLVELVRIVEARNGHCRFSFAGTGIQLKEMQTALRNSRIVEFLGEVPNRQIQDVVATNDVFVLLSDYEGLPLSLLEAMGHGLVPVVSDLESGIRQIVPDDAGIRVPLGDVSAAAEAILGLEKDRTRIKIMSDAAYRIGREFSAERMADHYLKLIEELNPKTAAWPENVSIPTPLGLRHPWMFNGIPRVIRRISKKALRLFP